MIVRCKISDIGLRGFTSPSSKAALRCKTKRHKKIIKKGKMWRRCGRGFLATGSTAPDAFSSSSVVVAAALLRLGTCGLHHLPLSSPPQVLPWHHHRQPALRPALRHLLRLPTSAEAPSSVGVARLLLQLGRPYSSEAFPNGGGETERRGQPNATATDVATCWNCGASPSSLSTEPFLVCGACRSVQPVDASVDFFQIFGLEKMYELQNDNLESKYKDWQKKLHPDLVHTKSKQERGYAAEQSARIIDAYHILRKPLSRALYLLKLEGFHVDEEKTISDPELLAEIMEIREAVEEATDSKALEGIKSEVGNIVFSPLFLQLQEKLQNWSNSFGKAFLEHDFGDAVISIQRMTYYERAIEEIVKKL
ncbi:hypothetical protein Taro_037502 [Colocasia esculenta]|uniref:J domain-containing protein n=1 Tax=Colocasia esculenta TaxID=4460 RepID=A0A843WD18_COLES|nr:hypothetical protein [Colocasia esculenta]